MQKVLFIILLFATTYYADCQESKMSEVIASIAEELASGESDEGSAEAFLERLNDLAEDPVSINSANEEEISRLFFLSDFQVKALADYLHTTGKIVSFNELALIPGFDKSAAEMLAPFITLNGREIITEDSSRFRNTLITNLSVRPGKNDTASLGSAWRALSKYKFSAASFSGGFTLEKDPGEKIITPGTAGPDFLSAYLTYSGQGLIRKIIVGDYGARFGQGLSINTSSGTGLSLTSPGYLGNSGDVRHYTSTDENNFFRGIAAILSWHNLEISLLHSRNYLDATVNNLSENGGPYISGFYKSGIHNTPALLSKKDAVSETCNGINISYNFQNLRLGGLFSNSSFSLPVRADQDDPEKLFGFNGRNSSIWSVYYSTMIRKILLYGELAANDIKKYAFVQGLSLRPSDRLTFNFLFWKYNQGFTCFHGKGPGSSTVSYPEQSLMGNFTFEAARHLFISGGCVIQHFPWLRYRTSSPSIGIKRELRIKYLPADKIMVDCLYGYRLSMHDMPALNGISGLRQLTSRSIRFSFRYTVTDNLILGTRLDYKHVDPSGSKGILLLEDFNYRVRSLPLSFWIRYCVFRSDDYDSRIYTWENDLLYSFSIPALYGEGSRFCFMLGWKIVPKAELRFKYGLLTRYKGYSSSDDSGEFRLQLKIAI